MRETIIVTIKDYSGKTKGIKISHNKEEAFEFMNDEDKKFNTETEFEIYYD